jgi:hypothetical protein
MSKKTKRQVARQISTMTAKSVEFNPDYSIIKRDLRRIGVLAGTFIVILVVLSFFQNQLLGIFLK